MTFSQRIQMNEIKEFILQNKSDYSIKFLKFDNSFSL
jgi:hypothetical protein